MAPSKQYRLSDSTAVKCRAAVYVKLRITACVFELHSLFASVAKLSCGWIRSLQRLLHSCSVPSMLFKLVFAAAATLSSSVQAAFGVTKSGSNFVVDAGSSNALVFTVNGANCDITSIKYRGEELQYASKGSHISSGLGSATVSSTIIGEVAHPPLWVLLNELGQALSPRSLAPRLP